MKKRILLHLTLLGLVAIPSNRIIDRHVPVKKPVPIEEETPGEFQPQNDRDTDDRVQI